MNTLQKEIDERTNLTGSNKFELLLFRLGSGDLEQPGELFGINVFKIREIVPMMPITKAAGTQSPVLGMINIRGQVISVIDLPAIAGCVPAKGLNILLITEFARSTQAFAVESVEEIVRWTGARCCRLNRAPVVTLSPASRDLIPILTAAAGAGTRRGTDPEYHFTVQANTGHEPSQLPETGDPAWRSNSCRR